MRVWRWLLAIVVVIGLGVAVYLFRPVNGPARDLTLKADATHGAYVLALGGCVACHTDTKNNGDVLQTFRLDKNHDADEAFRFIAARKEE